MWRQWIQWKISHLAMSFYANYQSRNAKPGKKALIIATLDNISEAKAHMSMATANLSSLAKITDPETFKLVLRAMVCPMVQLNIPPQFLDPVWDPEPMSAADQ